MLFLALVFMPAEVRADGFADGFEGADEDADGMPDLWTKISDNAHPHYNRVRFPIRDSCGDGGKQCVGLWLQGGAAAIETAEFININPERTYVLSGWARTAFMPDGKNRCIISVLWFDHTRTPLPQENRTGEVSGTSDWTYLQVAIGHVDARAAFAKIRCSAEGGDIKGECWFDGIELKERVSFLLASPDGRSGTVYDEGETVLLNLTCSDIEPGAYRLKVDLTDYLGKSVWGDLAATPPSPAPKDMALIGQPEDVTLGSRSAFSRTVCLGKLPPGYYEVTVNMARGEAPVAEAYFGLCVFARSYVGGSGGCIGTAFNPHLPDATTAARQAAKLGLRRAQVAIWDAAMPAQVDAQALKSVLGILRGGGMELTGLLAHNPLGGKSEPMLEFFASPTAVWEGPFAQALEESKELVGNWQFGESADPGFMNFRRTGETLREPATQARRILKFCALGVPAGIESLQKPELPTGIDFLTLHVPASMSPAKFEEHLARLSGIAPGATDNTEASRASLDWRFLVSTRRLCFAMDLPELNVRERNASAATQLSNIAKKAILARVAGAEEIYLAPFSGGLRGLVDERSFPTAAFPAARVLDELLTGATLMNGRVFESDVRNFVFRKGEECFVALWSDSGETSRDIYLGDAVKVVNLDGSIRPIAAVNGRRKVVIGSMPCFIVGVNSALLEMQLAVKIAPRRLELKTVEQRVDISITNKFPMTIKAVTMDAMFPASWNWRPKLFPPIPFLEKGETKGFGVNLALPRDETVGDKEVRILMSFSADKPECVMEVRRKLTIVSDFDADVVVRRMPAQRAFKITVLVTNNTRNAVNLFCSVAIGIMPQQEQMIVNIAGLSEADRQKGLKGGQKAAEFLIPEDESLIGKSIKVSLVDRESSRFLNKRVKLE